MSITQVEDKLEYLLDSYRYGGGVQYSDLLTTRNVLEELLEEQGGSTSLSNKEYLQSLGFECRSGHETITINGCLKRCDYDYVVVHKDRPELLGIQVVMHKKNPLPVCIQAEWEGLGYLDNDWLLGTGTSVDQAWENAIQAWEWLYGFEG